MRFSRTFALKHSVKPKANVTASRFEMLMVT
jgi:hypothetical protein